MLVDEEFLYHCDKTQLNKIASYLYETDLHGYQFLGMLWSLEKSMEMQELSFVECQKNSSILSFLNWQNWERGLKMQEIEISKGIKRIQFDSFDSWLNARHGIGGSDASAVLGLNPYKTNYWSLI